MGRAIEDWKKRRRDRGSVWPEVMFACFLIAWGLAFLNPFQSFSLVVSYAVLASVASEEAWGVFMAGVGLAWLAIVVLGFNRLRMIAGSVGAAILLWMGLSIFLSNPNSTLAGPTTVIGIGAVYSSVRLLTLWTQLRQLS